MAKNTLERITAENNRNITALDRDTRSAILDMVYYARSKGLGMLDTEVLRRDLIAMAQEAALRGETLDDQLGASRQTFCDALLEQAAPPRGEKWVYALYTMAKLMLWHAISQVLLWGSDIPLTIVYIGIAAAYLLLSLLGIYLERFRIESGWKKYLPEIALFVLFMASLYLVTLVKRYVEFTVFATVGWTPLVCIHAFAFLLVRAAWNRCVDKAASGTAV